MSLVETIKAKILDAVKNGKEIERDILKLALGEIQTIESREGSITDEKAEKAIRKIIEGNNEMLVAIFRANADDKNRAPRLNTEIIILESLLPKIWDEYQLKAYLHNGSDENVRLCRDIVAAKNDGQATGQAMKILKAKNLPVDGKTVVSVVKQIRDASMGDKRADVQ